MIPRCPAHNDHNLHRFFSVSGSSVSDEPLSQTLHPVLTCGGKLFDQSDGREGYSWRDVHAVLHRRHLDAGRSACYRPGTSYMARGGESGARVDPWRSGEVQDRGDL
jgi:hypothetical protein